ncbi:MAG: hypothetical protein ACI8W3_001146 [Myxococcota bacterium]|jgi:hypothetical protein
MRVRRGPIHEDDPREKSILDDRWLMDASEEGSIGIENV